MKGSMLCAGLAVCLLMFWQVQPASTQIAYVNLRVLGQYGAVVHFKVKRTTELRKLMESYCSRLNLDKDSVEFTFDGVVINDTDTPDSMEMEDGDTIYAN